MAHGVTPTGFIRKTQDEILSDLNTAARAAPALGPTIDTSPESPIGQLHGIASGGLAEVWEVLEETYHSNDPDQAGDFSLRAVSAITGTEARAASATRVPCIVTLNPGTTLPADTTLASVDGRDDIVCALEEEVTNAGGAPAGIPAFFVCTTTGPIAINSGTLTVIVTPVAGWTAITNATDGAPGRYLDNDITLRQRREQALARRGGSTVKAIRADLLDSETHPELAGIESVIILENTTNATNIDGLPAKSFECLIDDGSSPSVADEDIAQSIWDTKPSGIQAYGSTSALATDVNDDTHAVGFSRVERVPVYIELAITINSKFPVDGLDLVKAAIKAAGEANFDTGDDVVRLVLMAAPLGVVGVTDVPSLTLGTAPAPVSTANVPMGVRQRPTFDAANIGVVA